MLRHGCFRKICTVGILPVTLWHSVTPADAQIISAQDSVQTQVSQHGNQFHILGGTTADNATLLFHSFEQFDLEHNQIAKFRTAPDIEAIFGRITNGAESYIDGSIHLSGNPASLYLINPAGVVFGANASINLLGDLTVLTAERLDFDQGYFGVFGHPNDVEGNVLKLHFNPSSPGHIVNLGNLHVGASHSLSLIGHSVFNQGTLSGGAINVVAVGTHQSVVLDGGIQFDAVDNVSTLPPWLLPAGSEHATAIELDQDGTLVLTGSPLSDISSGTALVSGQLTADHGLNRIQIFGDHVATAGATVQTTDGGQILIGGGFQGRGFLPTAQSTLIDADSTIVADGETGGQIVVWSDETTLFRGNISAQGHIAGGRVEISAKEQLYFDGQVDLRSHGTPGTLLLDPENIEIRAGSAPGNVNFNESHVFYEDTLESSITGDANLLFQADNDITIEPLSDGELTFSQGAGSVSFLADADADGQGSFTIAPENRLSAPGRNISITAADITAGELDSSLFSAIDNAEKAGDIRLTATNGNIVSGDLTSTARSTLNNSGNGGEITLSASGLVTVGDITTATNALNNNGNAGEISIDAHTGTLSAGTLDASTSGINNTGVGGDITLSAASNITLGDSITSANATTNNTGNAGNMSFTSHTGAVTTASLTTGTRADNSNTGNGGSIVLNAPLGTITSQQITSMTVSPDSAKTQGGDIQLTSDGPIVVDSINAAGQDQGGNINVTTQQVFRAIDTIPNSNTSLLTTGDSTVRLFYNSVPAIPFILGDSAVSGTAGNITAGVDTLTAPQRISQPVSLDNIELKNLFNYSWTSVSESFDSGSVSQETQTASPFLATPTVDNLDLFFLESLNLFNNGKRQLNQTASPEQKRTTSNSELIWTQIERTFSNEFAQALKLPIPAAPSLATTQQTLRQVSNTQGISPALMYVRLKDTHIELMLVSGDAPPVYRPVAVVAADVQAVIETFHQTVTNPVLRPAQYLPASQQLYDWLIRPMLDELTKANIDHIGFVLDAGLRSLPMAALHDGERFLIESYSIGLLPSAGLTPLEPSLALASESDLFNSNATLAMGIANFEEHADLAAVPFELELASQNNRDERYLDHEATLDALQQRLEQRNFSSVHLATHAVFQPGSLDTSYVQLWDQTIRLNQLRDLPLDAIDFLILSACATALGDKVAEFGFAGLAVSLGVQTVLASLWAVSDEGTLGLMAEFYRALKQPLTRNGALRQAQLAMLRGQVGMTDGTVYSRDRTVGYLPSLSTSGSWDFSHPAYWSGFTMIGNPW